MLKGTIALPVASERHVDVPQIASMGRPTFARHAIVCATCRGGLCVPDVHLGVAAPARRAVGVGRGKRVCYNIRCWRGVQLCYVGCDATRVVFGALPDWTAERRRQVGARRASGLDVRRLSTQSRTPDYCQRYSSTDRVGLDSALGSAARDPALLFPTLISRFI
jgi:hypothetical protein